MEIARYRSYPGIRQEVSDLSQRIIDFIDEQQRSVVDSSLSFGREDWLNAAAANAVFIVDALIDQFSDYGRLDVPLGESGLSSGLPEEMRQYLLLKVAYMLFEMMSVRSSSRIRLVDVVQELTPKEREEGS